MKSLKTWLTLLKDTVGEFNADNGMKLSASLAYYTVFSIGPLMLLAITLTSLFFEEKTITGTMYGQMSRLVGKQGADQVISIITNLQKQQGASTYSIVGLIVLFFGASGIFIELQSSLNYIWSLKTKPQKGWLRFIRIRLFSFSLIIGLGFVLVVSLFVNTLLDLLFNNLQRIINFQNLVVFKWLNILILLLIIAALFSVIFRQLPDARIAWRDAFVGAFFTALLFLLGKYFIGLYLQHSNVGNSFGAAASFIILLTWIYYSSIILYLGAEFTKVYALNRGRGIRPDKNAVFIIKKESEKWEADTDIDGKKTMD